MTAAMKSEDDCFLAGKLWQTVCWKAETKVHIVKAAVFLVVMYSCESWTVKKAEWQRIDAFELWCWRILLRVPWTARRSNQSNLKGNQPWILIGRTDAKAEAPIFWSSAVNSWFIGKVPDTGKDWGQKEKRLSEDEMAGCHHRCNGMNLGKLWEMVRDREPWSSAVLGVAKWWTWLGDWTMITKIHTHLYTHTYTLLSVYLYICKVE